MKRLSQYFFAILVLGSLNSDSLSQSLLDGLRLTSNPVGTGARSFGMGGAMIAAANDYSALDYNPAALTILEHGELSVSLFNKSLRSDAQFLGTATANSISNTVPFSFAYASPIETVRGHLAFALSYDRVNDFTSTYKFSAVNPNSSFLNTKAFIQDPGYKSGDFNTYLASLDGTNLAWAIYLTNFPTQTNSALTTPLKSGLLQSGTVTQEGGTNALRIGAGVDVSEDIAVGATVNVLLGTYDYRRVYQETDINAKDTSSLAPPLGFKSAQIVDTRAQSISGVNLKLGLYASPNEYIKVGLTMETPSYFSIDDRFTRYGISTFANKTYDSRELPTPVTPTTVNSYSVTTPMKFGAGFSFNHWDLTIAASANYCDYSQLHFSDENVDLNDLNDAARDQLRSVLSWQVGAEYFIKPIGVLVRGGYSLLPSSYKNDPSEYNTTSISAGLGVLLSKSAMIEFGYKNTRYRTDHSIYNGLTVENAAVSANINQDDISIDQISVGFSFRF